MYRDVCQNPATLRRSEVRICCTYRGAASVPKPDDFGTGFAVSYRLLLRLRRIGDAASASRTPRRLTPVLQPGRMNILTKCLTRRKFELVGHPAVERQSHGHGKWNWPSRALRALDQAPGRGASLSAAHFFSNCARCLRKLRPLRTVGYGTSPMIPSHRTRLNASVSRRSAS